jgi:hypothetical protein
MLGALGDSLPEAPGIAHLPQSQENRAALDALRKTAHAAHYLGAPP